MNFVNGYSYPTFKVYDGTTFIESIALDYCGAEGLIENMEFITVQHNYTDYSTAQVIEGVHYYFDLSYSEYSNKTNTLKIKRILNYAIDGNKIFIYPRTDVLNRFFEVLLIPDNLTIGIAKGGISAIGNKHIKLKFRTKDLQAYVNWVDPNDLTVCLWNYTII